MTCIETTETDLSHRNFTLKAQNFDKENTYLTENQFGRIETRFAVDNHSNMSTICTKNYNNWDLRNINFSRNCPKFYIIR